MSLPVPSRPVLPAPVGGSYPLGKSAPLGVLGALAGAPVCSSDHQPLCKGPFSKKVCPIQAAHRDPPLPSPSPKPPKRTHRHTLKEGQGGRSCRDERVGGQQAGPTQLDPPSWAPGPSCPQGSVQSPLFSSSPGTSPTSAPGLSLPRSGSLGPRLWDHIMVLTKCPSQGRRPQLHCGLSPGGVWPGGSGTWLRTRTCLLRLPRVPTPLPTASAGHHARAGQHSATQETAGAGPGAEARRGACPLLPWVPMKETTCVSLVKPSNFSNLISQGDNSPS